MWCRPATLLRCVGVSVAKPHTVQSPFSRWIRAAPSTLHPPRRQPTRRIASSAGSGAKTRPGTVTETARTSFDFGSLEYWNKFYARQLRTGTGTEAGTEAGWFEWFEPSSSVYPAVAHAISAVSSTIPPEHAVTCTGSNGLRILHIGAGTSSLGMDLAIDGHDVENIDICVEAVDFLESHAPDYIASMERSSGQPQSTGQCSFTVLSVLEIEEYYGQDAFDIVVDKGSFAVTNFQILAPCVLQHPTPVSRAYYSVTATFNFWFVVLCVYQRYIGRSGFSQ